MSARRPWLQASVASGGRGVGAPAGTTAATAGRAALAGGSLAGFLAVAHLVNDAVAGAFAPLLPTLQARFGLGTTALALLVALLSFCSLLTQPLFGALADRFGPRPVAALGIVLCTSLLGLVAVAPALWVLVALLVVGGLGSAAFHPAGVILAGAAGEARRGLAVSLFSAGGTIGLALGPVAVLALVATFGLGAAPWLGVPGLVVGALLFVLAPRDWAAPQRRAGFVDRRLLAGPVGLLCLAATAPALAMVTFASAAGLWLVGERGVAPDDGLIGWTMAAFSLAAAAGGVTAAALSGRVEQRWLVAAPMLLAPLPLLAIFAAEPGTAAFFLAVVAGGALVNAGLPVLLLSAQRLAPGAAATAAGMLMGLPAGIAGVLYAGVGWLEGALGLQGAMAVAYLAAVPGALLAAAVLGRHRPAPAPLSRAAAATVGCACAEGIAAQCACAPAAETEGADLPRAA